MITANSAGITKWDTLTKADPSVGVTIVAVSIGDGTSSLISCIMACSLRRFFSNIYYDQDVYIQAHHTYLEY